MTVHFDWIGKFKTKMSGNTGINFDSKPDKKLMFNITMKCADVNNITKVPAVSRTWTDMIMEEFFMQGEQEKAKNIPISAFMNRETTDIAKCQIVH
jgi:hypothetical protein